VQCVLWQAGLDVLHSNPVWNVEQISRPQVFDNLYNNNMASSVRILRSCRFCILPTTDRSHSFLLSIGLVTLYLQNAGLEHPPRRHRRNSAKRCY
jgi:hypothetical protein